VRQDLREDDGSRKGLDGTNPTKKLWILSGAEQVIRATFQTYAHAIGLYGYILPDMDEIATLASEHHDNFVRGGEAHMEVGKLVHFVQDQLNHMTLSVKPFGCMPSSGVSDGVQAAVQGRFPEAIFLPIETTGDGAVNVYSRVQMMLYKAKKKCEAELDDALSQAEMDREQFQARLAKSRYSNPFKRPKHRVAGTAANIAYALS
jgi:predicted nucleotide-binding protein (sugar kinase/HSP70/actin superfamily)